MATPLPPEVLNSPGYQALVNPAPVIPANQPAPDLPIPQPAPLPPPPDDSGSDSDIEPSFTEKLVANANRIAAVSNPSKPGQWARNLVGAAIDSLGGAASDVLAGMEAPVKPGQGGMGVGMAAAMANAEQRKVAATKAQQEAQQKQIVNQREDARLAMEQQKTAEEMKAMKVNLAHAQIQLHNAVKAGWHEDEKYWEDQIKNSNSAIEMLDAEGSQRIQTGLTYGELANLIQIGKVSATRNLWFPTGRTPVFDTDGKPLVDDENNPIQHATYSVYTIPKDITLNDSQAAYLTKNNPEGQTFTAGEGMSADTFYYLHQKARATEVALANAAKVQSEVREHLTAADRNEAEARAKNKSDNEKLADTKTAHDFSRYLGETGGDPVLAIQLMRKNHPELHELADRAEKMYGFKTLETMRHQRLTEWEAAIKDDQKKLDNYNDFLKAPQPPPNSTKAEITDFNNKIEQEKTDLQTEIGNLRAKRNQYLGLHASDPADMADKKEALDSIPANQRAFYIAGITDPARRAYFYKIYKIAPPQAAPQVQPQPAKQ